MALRLFFKRRDLYGLCLLISLIAAFIFVHRNSDSRNSTNYEQATQDYKCDDLLFDKKTSSLIYLQPHQLESVQIVIFWSTYFGRDPHPELSLPSSIQSQNNESMIFYQPNCYADKYPQFVATTNRSYLTRAKALVFHWRDYDADDYPTERSPEQLWILVNMESPLATPRLPEYIDPSLWFNLTANYRSDSDLVMLYDELIPRKAPLCSKGANVLTAGDISSKSKPIVWLVSNRGTSSRREYYVRELRRFVKVDIYGRCGNLTCDIAQEVECFRMFEKDYFFYLSFENAICKDYITEKSFNALKHGTVPVVFGGANYSNYLPPNSYIDATEMMPGDLAQLLDDISKNETRYLQYFEWKRHYIVDSFGRPTYTLPNKSYCTIFKKLQEWNKSNATLQHRSKSPKEINSWYFDKACGVRKVKLFNLGLFV